MKSEWNTSAIANICKVVTDGSHTSPKSVSHGKYMVSVKDFTPYGFDFNGCRQISFADYEKLKSSGCVPQKGDILIGKDGARYFEDIIIYNQDEAPALLSSIAILRCDEEKVIPEYLYYLLKTPSFKKDVKDNYGSGSAIPRIILKDFKRMKVEYPSIEKQRQIVSILHDLDAKIFNNQKVNDNFPKKTNNPNPSPIGNKFGLFLFGPSTKKELQTMPKTLLEKVVFTIVMAAIMVYGMIVYNVALNTGGVTNATFLMALHEMPIMVPGAFVLEFFVVEKLATALAFTFMRPSDRPQFITYAISLMIVAIMCPVLSLVATVLFKEPSFGMWMHTWGCNMPMALCWQMLYCGPLSRFIFRRVFRRGKAENPAA